MNRLIKATFPERLMPVAQRVHRKVFKRKVEFSKDQYEALSALKCIVSYNKYGGYCVPESSRERPAAKRILAHDIYEPGTIELIRTHCGEGDVVHAGTYFGDFLPAIAGALARNARAWAFEPNRENYRCARITLELNDIPNVLLSNAGLGARRESLLMQTLDDQGRALGGGSRIIGNLPAPPAGTEAVQVVTVDESVSPDRNVSILQLDVEGHEKEALAGALGTIERSRPLLILEVLPGSQLLDSGWFSQHILGLGYRKIDEVHGNSVFSC